MPFLVFSEEQSCQACTYAHGTSLWLVKETTWKRNYNWKSIWRERNQSKVDNMCQSLMWPATWFIQLEGLGQALPFFSSPGIHCLLSEDFPLWSLYYLQIDELTGFPSFGLKIVCLQNACYTFHLSIMLWFWSLIFRVHKNFVLVHMYC